MTQQNDPLRLRKCAKCGETYIKHWERGTKGKMWLIDHPWVNPALKDDKNGT